jgi:hypothetical protein
VLGLAAALILVPAIAVARQRDAQLHPVHGGTQPRVAPNGDQIALNVPGIINFNHSAGGDNVIVQIN